MTTYLTSVEQGSKPAMAEQTQEPWHVYMLRCADGRLYTGISTDVMRRLQEHRGALGNSKGAKALRGKSPLTLVWQVACADRSEASRLEYRIKQLPKASKEILVAGKLAITDIVGEQE